MAHLWSMDPRSRDPIPLLDPLHELEDDPHGDPRTAASGAEDAARTLLVCADASGDAWCLLAGIGTEVFVNGRRVVAGIRLLRDRDEIRLPDSRRWYFFGTERLARVEPFPGDRSASCPRCRQAVQPGTPAVRCPSCGLWHHGSEALPCWSYADTCAMCSHATSLEAGYRWTPEAL
jgi:hypothetical protein